MGSVASEKPSRCAPVYCKQNGKYYTTPAKMQMALAQSRKRSGKTKLKGRKRRCLTNGRMYVNKERMASGLEHSKFQKNSARNAEILDHMLETRNDCDTYVVDRVRYINEFFMKKDGKLVITFIDCEREKSSGVVLL